MLWDVYLASDLQQALILKNFKENFYWLADFAFFKVLKNIIRISPGMNGRINSGAALFWHCRVSSRNIEGYFSDVAQWILSSSLNRLVAMPLEITFSLKALPVLVSAIAQMFGLIRNFKLILPELHRICIALRGSVGNAYL